MSFPFVIKPSIGFLSIGDYIINDENDWIKAKEEITPHNLKSIFPKNVLDTSHFILEDFIQGEEYAVDYYIIPIEINPLRFGGWYTAADLSGITVGLNSYKYYFENTYPNWDRI